MDGDPRPIQVSLGSPEDCFFWALGSARGRGPQPPLRERTQEAAPLPLANPLCFESRPWQWGNRIVI